MFKFMFIFLCFNNMNELLIQWLFSTPNRWTVVINKVICDVLFDRLMLWFNNNGDKEIHITVPYDDFKVHFYLFLFNLANDNYGNYKKEENEIFTLKYHDDIVNLFITFKDICNSYTVDYFDKKGTTADKLLNFMNEFIVIDENIPQDEVDHILIVDDDQYI